MECDGFDRFRLAGNRASGSDNRRFLGRYRRLECVERQSFRLTQEEQFVQEIDQLRFTVLARGIDCAPDGAAGLDFGTGELHHAHRSLLQELSEVWRPHLQLPIGGVLGGWVSAMFIKHTPLQTPDLLLTAAAIIAIIFVLTWFMGRAGIFCEVDHVVRIIEPSSGGWRILSHSRYLLLIAAILLLAQLASPIVEYQFLNSVEASYPEREARTAFLSLFFAVLGAVSIAVNMGITPLVHRALGAIAGLLVQPLMIWIFSWCFFFQSTLFFAGATKISDRAMSYSINRASKELLYVPVDSILIYQAKAWIDMFGYRLFKVAGSVLILLFTQWLPFTVSLPQLSWFTVSICVIWIILIMVLRHDYQQVCEQSV